MSDDWRERVYREAFQLKDKDKGHIAKLMADALNEIDDALNEIDKENNNE